MGKLSGLSQESTFGLTDLLIKVKAAGSGDVIVALQDFLNVIGSLTSNPCKFNVYRNAAQTPGGGGVIQYDTKNFDTGSNVDIVTHKGRFTVPFDGFYQLNVISSQNVTAAPNDPQVNLKKNGTTNIGYAHFVNMYNGASTGSTNLSVLVELAASDYVEVIGTTLALDVIDSSRNVFSGFFVSKT